MRHFVDFCQFYIIFAVAPEFSTCTILHLCHSQSKNLPLLGARHILGTEKKTHISERHIHIRM